jgi:hypothetical protein
MICSFHFSSRQHRMIPSTTASRSGLAGAFLGEHGAPLPTHGATQDTKNANPAQGKENFTPDRMAMLRGPAGARQRS